MRFSERFHHAQSLMFRKDLVSPERIAISHSWFNKDTADYWRHARMYECADCLTHRPNASWLVVGDGRWGLDSIRLREKGLSNALATDLCSELLEESKRRGLIETYAIENAEALTFADESFDFVFCKESLHHFPRPYLALYEMLRVAKEAVFLVEPNDRHPGLEAARQFVKDQDSGKVSPFPLPGHNDWEVCGNYVFSISRREMTKIALALDLPQVIFKGLNDIYVKGGEFEPADLERSAIFRQIVEHIADNDARCERGEADYSMLMAGIFKVPMDEKARTKFASRSWQILELPRNPHMRE